MCETDLLDLTREAREGANSILRQPVHALVSPGDWPDNNRKNHERQHQRGCESRARMRAVFRTTAFTSNP